MLTVAQYYRVLDIGHHNTFVIEGHGNGQPAKTNGQYNKFFALKI